jgi:hypothetical protein
MDRGVEILREVSAIHGKCAFDPHHGEHGEHGEELEQ